MKGAVQVCALRAPSLEGNPLGDSAERRMPVYLPPGYAAGGSRYPVVYFLHGFTGSGVGWLNTVPFQPGPVDRLDALITGGLPPIIAVYVDGWTALGGSQWINSEAIGRYQDYLAKDVVGYVDQTFRTLARPEARAVVGKSSGGYGALTAARDRTDVFLHFGCHSGDAFFEYCYLADFPKALGAFERAGGVQAWFKAFGERARTTKTRGEDHAAINTLAMAAAYGTDLPFDLRSGRLLPDIWARWLEHDPVRFVPKRLDAFRKVKGLFIDCGLKDEFNLQWGARMVAEALRGAGVELQHEEFEDGHMGIYYRYDRSLSYLVPRMAR